ncbi:MAG: acylphosphatase [Candidatus Omnitrophota bacterium]|nr:acylphosphatase [Candidatus Omnitrophota bacterium]MDZ4242100.1 acylphosphatase [Candidatus Omnitrophota bacterium]
MPMVLAHIFYSGMVQGVGFRYTSHRIASDAGLKGWVRNLSDGRVELELEGARENVEEFMRRIDEHFSSYVRGKDITLHPASGQFREFKILP